MLNHSPNQGLPETIRVRVQRGFRGLINGRFAIANPGDVVEVPRALAMEMRGSGRAVMSDEPLVTQKDYLPERKKPQARAKADPVQAQLIALTTVVEGLQKTIESLAAVGGAKK